MYIRYTYKSNVYTWRDVLATLTPEMGCIKITRVVNTWRVRNGSCSYFITTVRWYRQKPFKLITRGPLISQGKIIAEIVISWCHPAYCKHVGDIWRPTPCSWWRHQMETLSVLLVICAGNSPVSGEIHSTKASDAEFWCYLWSAPG